MKKHGVEPGERGIPLLALMARILPILTLERLKVRRPPIPSLFSI
jgi:hypothetical protein